MTKVHTYDIVANAIINLLTGQRNAAQALDETEAAPY